MLVEEDYERLKELLIESQTLFNKLNLVADQYADIEYEQDGFFGENEERLKRHWSKLSSKIIDNVASVLDGYKIELYKNRDLSLRELHILFTKDEQKSKIGIDYGTIGSISIVQAS